jgi:SAM-dependent methyltransferase
MDEFLDTNRRNWDDRVAGHMAPDGYAVDLLVDHPDHLTDVVRFDAERVGPVDGLRLLHSQCHIGTDTLSWARLGATVTGFDFSPKAIAAAQSIAERMGIDATFVEAEVATADAAIDGPFDFVYTSVGAICWLPDLSRWAEVLTGLLRPGGRFYIRDTHPSFLALDDERADDLLVTKYPYFHETTPMQFTDTSSYMGSAVLTEVDTHEWAHPISEIIGSLLDAGLVLDRFDEYQHLDWPALPSMTSVGQRWYLPESLRSRVPTQFSVLAHKPED